MEGACSCNKVVSIMEGEWSCHRSGHFKGGRMDMLQKSPV